MSRGGWRKRASDDDGWGSMGGYMAAKVCKLEEQFKLDAPRQQQKEGTCSNIFSGVAIYVNGYTDPTADELRRLMMLHGGQFHMYYSRSKTTHIIATNLPNTKIKELKGEKVVRPEWITDSIKAGHLLSYLQYQLYAKQKGLSFSKACLFGEPSAGPSHSHKELEGRVNGLRNIPDLVRDLQVNGLVGEESHELGHPGPPSPSLDRKPREPPPTLTNGHAHPPNGALKPQELSPCPGRAQAHSQAAPRLPVTDSDVDFRDGCGGAMLRPPGPLPLRSPVRLNGSCHPGIQGPLHAKSPSELPSSRKPASPGGLPKPTEPNFISDFYSHSRLHHISTWKCEFTDFVNMLQRRNSGIFPGKEKLRRQRPTRTSDPGNSSTGKGSGFGHTCRKFRKIL